MTHDILFELAAIVALGIAAQWISWRLRLPSILMLLGAGLLVGPVFGFLEPDEIFGPSLPPLVSLAVALILFEGGLSLRIRDLREIGIGLTGLVTTGVLVAAALNALAARFILGLEAPLALLLGAILTVTGPTVVLPLLRHIKPRGKAGTLARWEGILNDPAGAILAVLVFEALVAGDLERGARSILTGVGETLAAGLGFGLGAAALLVVLLRFRQLPEFLESTFTLALVLGVFAASDAVQADSGLLSVTLFGIALANQRWVEVTHIVEFKENLRVLLISSLFVLLAARLDPASLRLLDARAAAFVIALILVVRPLTVLLGTLGSRLTWREKGFMAWMAPRGIVAAAVSSVFALRLGEAGYPGSEILVPVVFLVIMVTVTVYGLTARPVALFLGVSGATPEGCLFLGAQPWARGLAACFRELGVPVIFVDKNPWHVEAALREGFEAHLGDVLDDRLPDRLPLEKLGRFFALTSNPEVNLLGAHLFARSLGRDRVFRIATHSGEDAALPVPTGAVSDGRVLFGQAWTYEDFEDRYHHAGRFRTVTMDKEADPEAAVAGLGRDPIPVFVYSGSALRAADGLELPELKLGDRMIVLVGGEPESPGENAPSPEGS